MLIGLVVIYVLVIEISASMQILLFLEMLDIVELSLNLIKWVWIMKVSACVVYLIIFIIDMKENESNVMGDHVMYFI